MSSVPPNVPPGGGTPPPFPPYDAKTQWRVYKEQQKAAWRAQRDAMKAQAHVWKSEYRGAYGPRVPSIVGPVILIGVGVVALLVVTGRLAAADFWAWYGRWWPLLLIGAGLALLAEWALDMRRDTPVHRGGNFVGMLVVLAILGICAAGWNNFWGPFRANFGDRDDFFNSFGLPEHDNDMQPLTSQVSSNSAIEIQNPRGDISVTAGDASAVEVHAHEVAYASNDGEAKKIFDAEAPHIVVSGNSVLIKSDSSNSGRLNLTVTVPKSARVTVNSGHGDITAADLGAGIGITAPHGDVHVNGINGNVQVHLSNDKHDFSAHQVTGDIDADGHCNDLTFSEIKGKVVVSGEIFGEVHMENVAGQVNLHTSVTELQVGQLLGDLTLNSDDLRVTEARGQVRVTTHSKDVDLSQIYGESYVEDRDGRISIAPAGAYGVEAKNSKGDVELTLPPNASANINARTHNGDIVSDYPLPSSEGANKTANFTVGGGSTRIVLSADNGDVRVKKGSAFPTAPPPPPAVGAAPKAPNSPSAANVPHLRAPKTPTPAPEQQ